MVIILVLGLVVGCTAPQPESREYTAADLHRTAKTLTDVIVHDVFSPPVASRIYAYASIASWETAAALQREGQQGGIRSLAGQLNGLGPAPTPENVESPELAALLAYWKVARQLVFSPGLMDERMAMIIDTENIPAGTEAYAEKMAAHIMEWASKDGYNQSRTYELHPEASGDDEWTPTPPLFMAAIEPHWNSLRTFGIDSATQFIPLPPTEFDLSDGSPFRAEIDEVYQTSIKLNEEEEAIARFWDCNPFVTEEQAHLMPATKKITPGGHWMGITRIACELTDRDFHGSLEAYVWTTIALADAFISCWDEKYRSNLIRPETVINRYVDGDWKPLLETPPFPEYTSGHSVISTAAAEVLSSLFGEPFEFVDSVEVEYGLPPRSFNSFREACAEAAISRLYGGIHYRPAIEQGVVQGRKVGNYLVKNLSTRSNKPANSEE